MLSLVNDLLDFLQIKNKRFKKNLRWSNIKESIIELLELFRLGANEKGIDLKYKFDENFP
jgi:signal transduction histidine kinase